VLPIGDDAIRMQLSATAMPTAMTPPTASVPTFVGGIDYEGTDGRFQRFSAHATGFVYGDQAGYETLQAAMDAATMATIGARQAAAGIYELDGRFHARRLDNVLTFANGTQWTGTWRLEQFPADLELLDGRTRGTTTRVESLRAIVDGAQRHDVSHLAVAQPTPR
jgi:hypothetical protein